MELTYSLEQIDLAASALLDWMKTYKVFALNGEMGAGKTTLVHAVCEALQVKDRVGSPTFSIINQYEAKTGETLYHIDLYRLKDEEEAIRSGVEDCIESGSFCLIEWPQRAPGLFPPDTVQVFIEAIGTNTRKLRIKL